MEYCKYIRQSLNRLCCDSLAPDHQALRYSTASSPPSWSTSGPRVLYTRSCFFRLWLSRISGYLIHNASVILYPELHGLPGVPGRVRFGYSRTPRPASGRCAFLDIYLFPAINRLTDMSDIAQLLRPLQSFGRRASSAWSIGPLFPRADRSSGLWNIPSRRDFAAVSRRYILSTWRPRRSFSLRSNPTLQDVCPQ